MGIAKGNKRPDAGYVFGPNTSDTSYGDGTGFAQPAGDTNMANHGMKGIIGAMRARTYTPSDYGGGDKGGSAGGYGVGHGAAGAGGPGAKPMVSFGYTGAALGFEGGVRGGGVSEPETLPAQYQYPAKKGYDEHHSAAGTVHEVAGVEGIPSRRDGMDGGDEGSDTEMSEGMSGSNCHACGFAAKTGHGLVQHMMARHGARSVAHRMGMGGGAPTSLGMSQGKAGVPSRLESHGTAYGSSKEFPGETEGPAEWQKIRSEYETAAGKLGTSGGSSYGSGDSGGSYGTMSSIIGGR